MPQEGSRKNLDSTLQHVFLSIISGRFPHMDSAQCGYILKNMQATIVICNSMILCMAGGKEFGYVITVDVDLHSIYMV